MIYLFKIANLFVHQPNSVKLVAVTFFIPTQSWLIKRQSCHHIETSQLICRANQLTGFYMVATLALNELQVDSGRQKKLVLFASMKAL